MPDPLLINLTGTESEGTKWAVVQRWVKQAVINAGIIIPMSDPMLSDINFADSEGTKWAKLQRWLTLLAQNISGGGGGAVNSLIAGSGIALSPPTGVGNVTISATAAAPTDYVALANSSGDTTITPDKPIYTVGLNLTGAARTSKLILVAGGATVAGDKIRLVITLPVTPNIVLEVHNATSGGTQLLPVELFASNQYTTNGLDLSATWDFVFTGTTWKYEMSNIPA